MKSTVKSINIGILITMLIFSLINCQEHDNSPQIDKVINFAAIQGVTAPAFGETPVTEITPTIQYTGTVVWSPVHNTFQNSTVYFAKITLTPKKGYTLQGIKTDFFKVPGTNSVSNDENSGVITAVFPRTAGTIDNPAVIDIKAIEGITPKRGEVPKTTINSTTQYTGTVIWSPNDNPFKTDTTYIATITLTPRAGFTFNGVTADSFTVEDANNVSNDTNSNIVTAVFFNGISISVPVTGVSLNQTTLSMTTWGTTALTATVVPSNATYKNVIWNSNNASVATVNSNGEVTAITAGTATITVTTVDGRKTATCTVTVESPSSVTIEMISIPAGTFIMGSPETEPDRKSDETQHSVMLSSFKMSKYQVTQAQWVAVMGASEDRTTTNYGKGENYPVYYVNWYNTIVFCNKLSMSEGLNLVYSINGSTNPSDWGKVPINYNDPNRTKWDAVVMDKSKNGYRLPTEAEWEYACRGSYTNKATETNTKPFGIGDGTKMVNGMANFDVKYPYDLSHLPAGSYNDESATEYVGKATAVGSYSANNYGLYDMHGNVYEWCWDWYNDITADNNNPTGAVTGTYRVLRGGGWYNCHGRSLRSAIRYRDSPYLGGISDGFRLVRL